MYRVPVPSMCTRCICRVYVPSVCAEVCADCVGMTGDVNAEIESMWRIVVDES